jgi:alpha-methylacyl-CoA racemase
MTGWGQDGPWARTAGHDIDYIAVAGVLAHIARRGQPPTPPLNLVGDYGGGAMFLVSGMLAALWHAERTGEGQVVDAAMVDGAALLMSLVHSMSAIGWWREEAGVNILDSGLPFYDAYLTADGKWLAIGCLEPQFYAEWLRIAGLDGEDLPAQLDPSGWRVLRQRFAEVVATRTRDEWAALADGTDACIAPVLTMSEAPHHPHLAARRTFVEVDGMMQAAPAPRFSGTPAGDPRPVVASDRSALLSWGVDAARISTLADAGVLPD